MPVLFDSRVNTLKSYIDQAPQFNKSKIEDIIELYTQRKILRYDTALKHVKLLATKYESKNANRKYDSINKKFKVTYDKYTAKTPKHLEKDDKFLPKFNVVNDGNHDSALTTYTIEITNGINADYVFKYSIPIIADILKKQLEIKKTIKFKPMLKILFGYRNKSEGDEDEEEAIIATNDQPVSISFVNLEDKLDRELIKLKSELLEFIMHGKSSIYVKRILEIKIDVYKIRPIRGASYIPTPEKYLNAKCGLVNIHNYDHECFRWCMRYHQSNQLKKF